MNLKRLIDFGRRTALTPVLLATPAFAASVERADQPPMVLSMTADPASPAATAGQLAGAARDRRVVFELVEGLTVTGVVRDRRDRTPDRFTIWGPVDTTPAGRFVVAVNGDAVAAYVAAPAAGAFRIRTGPGAALVVEKIDPGAPFACGVDDNRGSKVPARGGVAGDPCDDGSVIDVLVVYTQAALDDAGSIEAIEAEIDLAVEYNNVAYADSVIASSWNLAYVWGLPVGVDPDLGELTDPADGVADGVHALRDAYRGDVVALVRDGSGGNAWGILDLDPANEAGAFSVSGLSSWPSVMPHEIGHNLGCCHAIGDGGGCPPEGGLLFPYSNGHRFFGESAEEWRTIMAYNPGTLFGHFSNPSIFFDGKRTGVPWGEPGAADNAATINISRMLIANYRCHDGICEALGLPSDAEDCTGNGVPDLCDIALGTVEDGNGNGVPDECETCPGDCAGGGDGVVDVMDFLALLAQWGQVGMPCDFDGGGVGVTDFLLLLGNWGPCE